MLAVKKNARPTFTLPKVKGNGGGGAPGCQKERPSTRISFRVKTRLNIKIGLCCRFLFVSISECNVKQLLDLTCPDKIIFTKKTLFLKNAICIKANHSNYVHTWYVRKIGT